MGRRLAPVGGAVDEAHELTALRRSMSHVNSAPYRKDVYVRQLCLNNATYVRTRCHRRHGHNSAPIHPSNLVNNAIHVHVAVHTSPACVPRMTPRRARSES